jgi:hypothetical protein
VVPDFVIPAVRHSAHVDDDRFQGRRPEFGGIGLNVRPVRRAPHADFTVSVRKFADMCDRVEAILAFANLLGEVAFGCISSAVILQYDDVTVPGEEFG